MKAPKVIAVVGCMSRHWKEKLIENGADLVIGPDQYKRIPDLLLETVKGVDKEVEISYCRDQKHKGNI